MRAALTILGVVMGIMTVTGMSAIVAGLNASMARQILSLGSSVVFVRPFSPGENLSEEEWRRRKGLTRREVEAIRARPAVGMITAMEPLSAETVKYGNAKVQQARAFGVDQNYEVVHELWAERGRFISETDVARASRVVVLGFGGRGHALPLRGSAGQGDHGRRPPLPRDRGGAEDGEVPLLRPRQHDPRAAGRDAEARSRASTSSWPT